MSTNSLLLSDPRLLYRAEQRAYKWTREDLYPHDPRTSDFMSIHNLHCGIRLYLKRALKALAAHQAFPDNLTPKQKSLGLNMEDLFVLENLLKETISVYLEEIAADLHHCGLSFADPETISKAFESGCLGEV